MLTLLDNLLSKLPANNWKTIIGYVISSSATLPIPETWKLVLTSVGGVVTAIGVLHKAVKNVLGK